MVASFWSLKSLYLRYTTLGLGLLFILFQATAGSDFEIFLAASVDLLHHTNIYGGFYKTCYHYYYSPLFALALFPLTFINLYLAKLIWLALNLVFVFRTWKALSFFLDRTLFSEKQKLSFTLISFLFVLYFLIENFHCGQMTLFIFFLASDGIYRIMTGRYWLGGLFLSLAINIKLLPLVLLPYLFYRRYFKALAWSVGFLALWLYLPAVVIGNDFNNLLLHNWWALINPHNAEHVIDTAERSFHGLSSLLPALLMDHVNDPHVLHIKRNIANLNAANIEIILNVIRLFLILFSLFFFRTKPFKRAPNKLHAFREISYLFLLVPLIFPHQQHYAFYFMFPACSYMCYYLAMHFISRENTISRRKKQILVTGMAIIFLTNNLQFLLGQFGQYYIHFKIITYGALLLIPLIAIATPEEIPLRKDETDRI